MKPGLYGNLSGEEYHKEPGLSASGLRLLDKSPLHYKAAPRADTEALRFGTAVHCAVLEPERFEREYTRAPEGIDRRTKEGRAAWSEFEAASEGKTVLKPEDHKALLGVAEAVHAHPLAGKLLTGGAAEQSLFWNERVYYGGRWADILCKCRPDYVKPLLDGPVIVDLKTTRDAGAAKFQRSAYWDFGYHIQAAHYLRGFEAATGETARGFIFVAVEKEPPWAVNVFQAAANFLAAGTMRAEELYKVFAACKDNDEWPGYPAVIRELGLPPGATKLSGGRENAEY